MHYAKCTRLDWYHYTSAQSALLFPRVDFVLKLILSADSGFTKILL